jgi:transcriptional regulator with XRE-family HTH domain
LEGRGALSPLSAPPIFTAPSFTQVEGPGLHYMQSLTLPESPRYSARTNFLGHALVSWRIKPHNSHMLITETLTWRIVELRAKKGWSQSRLAEEAGITQSTLSRIENGTQEPRAQTLVKIADALDVEYRALLESGEGPPGKRSGLTKLLIQVSEIDSALEDLPVEKKTELLEFLLDQTKYDYMKDILRIAIGRMDEGEITHIKEIFDTS